MSIDKLTITSKVHKIIRDRLHLSREIDLVFGLDSKIKDDLGADSLSFVEIIMEAEDVFDIEIEDETAEKIITVDDLVAAVGTRVNVGAIGGVTNVDDGFSEVPFTEESFKNHMDSRIRYWRTNRDDESNSVLERAVASCRYESYQSIRLSMIGEALP